MISLFFLYGLNCLDHQEERGLRMVFDYDNSDYMGLIYGIYLANNSDLYNGI